MEYFRAIRDNSWQEIFKEVIVGNLKPIYLYCINKNQNMKTLKINHTAVWILVLIHQIIGAVWFSPFVFAEQWVHLTGKTMSDFSNATMIPYFVSIAGSIITIYAIAYLFEKLHVESFITGLFYAFIFWFAFLFVELMSFNSFELRPYGLTFIDAGKSLVTFLVTGFVLGVWKKYDAPVTVSS